MQHVERMGKLGHRWHYILEGAESSRILCEEDSFFCSELSLHDGMLGSVGAREACCRCLMHPIFRRMTSLGLLGWQSASDNDPRDSHTATSAGRKI